MADAAATSRFALPRIGLFAGTGLASTSIRDVMPVLEKSIDSHGDFSTRLLGERGLAATNPLLSFKILANMPPCLVSMIEGIKGPNLIFTPWEEQAAAALAEAWHAVATGDVDCALTGAADDPTNPASVVYLMQAGIISGGDAVSAAAAYLVLERAETAWRDGRRPYATVKRMDLVTDGTQPKDPVAMRMGRCFAASPGVALALACIDGPASITVPCRDGQVLVAELEAA
jgi:3-oxoacyl-(acyl-carrier-protein) synthase